MGELWGLRWPTATWTAVCSRCAGPTDWPPSRASRARSPSNPALLPILRQWRNDCPASDEALVFPSARGFMRQKDRDYGFKAALTGAECHAVTFHGLRHTFASHFIDVWWEHPHPAKAPRSLLGGCDDEVTHTLHRISLRDEIARLRFERPSARVADMAEQQGSFSLRTQYPENAVESCNSHDRSDDSMRRRWRMEPNLQLVVGLAGPHGSGCSTLAAELVSVANDWPGCVAFNIKVADLISFWAERLLGLVLRPPQRSTPQAASSKCGN